MQQQPSMKNTPLEMLTQKNYPLVHVLTSKTESDDAKV